MPDTTRLPVSFTVSMGCVIHREVKPLDGTLRSLSFRNSLHIDTLSQTKVSRSQAVSDREEILRGHFELDHVSFCWQVVLHKMSSLRFLYLVGVLLAYTDLDSVDAVVFEGLYLGDLATVDLDNSAGSQLTPLVPEMSHADFIPDQACPFGQVGGCFGLLDRELGVDFGLKRTEIGHLGVV